MRSAFLAFLILIPRPAVAVSVPLDLSGVRAGPITVARAEESVTPDETGRVWREFGSKRFEWRAKARGWKWARVAVWDVAGNGAFVNPFWRP